MDAQRKKGILEVCVLAVLKKGPSYGYLIIKELESCIEISESTLYPILKRLEQNGSLKTYRQEYNGRMRKYYELKEEGQKKIDQFLEEWDELQNMYRFVETQNQMERTDEKTEAEIETEPEAETEIETETKAAPDADSEAKAETNTEMNVEAETTTEAVVKEAQTAEQEGE